MDTGHWFEPNLKFIKLSKMIGLIIYFGGVAVQYVRVNTVYKDWKEERIRYAKKEYEMLVTPYLAIWGSWFAFIFMFVKNFLDKKYINKR